MRILHVGNICGIPQAIAEEQRARGMISEAISFPADYNLKGRADKFKALVSIIQDFDVIHFHYSTGLPFGIDLPLWKMMGKKVVMHYHGRVRRLGRPIMHKLVDKAYVATPDLLRYVPGATYIPNPVYLPDMPEVGSIHDPIRFLHLPTNRDVKGTKYIIAAIEQLEKDGYNLNFEIIEEMSHDEAITAIKNTDVVIDQLIVGWYGMVAIEAWALGKPVICNILPDLQEKYNVPACIANRDTIMEVIELFINNPSRCKFYGQLGREYVERYHDINKMRLED